MKKYGVYQHPLRGYEAVKSGFSWPAFWFSWIWAFIKRLPGIALSFLVAIAIAMIVDAASGSGFVVGLITGVILGLVAGSNGNDWRVTSLQKRGYKLIATVSAESPDGAIADAQTLARLSYLETVPPQSSPAVAAPSSGFSGDHWDGRPRRPCPFCAELILAEAIICRYCQRELPSDPAAGGPAVDKLDN